MDSKQVEELLRYAEIHLGLKKEDEIYFRNYLIHEFGLELPYEGEIDEKKIRELKVPDIFTDAIKEHFISKGFSEKDADAKSTEIYGHLSYLPSEMIRIFNEKYAKDKKSATDFFYDYCIKNNYVAKTAIDRNRYWQKLYPTYDVEITINLSKPEKNNKDIAKLLQKPATSAYPACVICIENEGCYGSAKTPPRENIRLIPLKLNNHDWYVQYSPYGYFEEHCIVIKKEHEPMCVCYDNLAAQVDFVNVFPHYFLGANADIPIVGGSILNHEHFQGGIHEMPMMRSEVLYEIPVKNHTNCRVFRLNWPSFALRVESDNRDDLLKIGMDIINFWKGYSDESIGLLAKTDAEHNSTTTVVRKKNGVYQLFILPRNNRTTPELPGGIYHVRPSLQFIKNEGIGLIEAMGLFILPARLVRQNGLVTQIVNKERTFEDVIKEYPDVEIFKPMIESLERKEFATPEDFISDACNKILHDISIFKDKESEKRFLEKVNL